jgi:hypothetical protein
MSTLTAPALLETHQRCDKLCDRLSATQSLNKPLYQCFLGIAASYIASRLRRTRRRKPAALILFIINEHSLNHRHFDILTIQFAVGGFLRTYHSLQILQIAQQETL